MKRTLRTMAGAIALSLAVFGLTGCTNDDDCDDASGTTTVVLNAAPAYFADGKGPGGKSRSGKSKPKPPKKSKHKSHHSDDCEDDD